MIPPSHIAAWRSQAPWPTDTQIEQDLILSRLMIEIANDDLLGTELAMRGGTCMHKLHLERALRYSEDLDYVRLTHSGFGPYLDRLREICLGVGLEEHRRALSGQMAHIAFNAEPAVPDGPPIRIKIETNISETDPFRDRITLTHRVDSLWFSGSAKILTYHLEELSGTKLRALYQRKKGRDLFDLWLVLTTTDVDDPMIIGALEHYMGHEVFSYGELGENLKSKLADQGFVSDLEALVIEPPEGYDAIAAADLIMERLGVHLKGAPSLDKIRAGAWSSPAPRPRP